MEKLSNEKAIERSKSIWGNFYDYSFFYFKNSRTPITLICPKHGKFEQIYHTHLRSGCYICGKEKRRNIDIIERFNKKHNFRYDYSKTIYTTLKENIVVICKVHGEFSITAGNHKNGNGCLKCNIDSQKLTKEVFIERSNKIHSSKFNYDNVVYENNHSKVKIICPFHGEFKQTPQNHLNSNGCPTCYFKNESDNRISYKNRWIERCNLFHGNIYDYSKSDYHNNGRYVIIICKKHGEFTQKPSVHLTHGCKLCSESKGEREVARYLDDINIKYIREYKFKECFMIKELLFDFYLPDLNMCIEFNGKQHYEPVKRFGGEERLIKQIKSDKIKKKFCKKNNISLIEVKYTESIVEKLEFLNEEVY